MIRIDWPVEDVRGFSESSTGLIVRRFDSRQRLSVFLQFKESMKEEYKTLKFSAFAYLIPEGMTETSDFEARIYPLTTRLSTVDKSSLVLTFQHNSLEKGTCYRLLIDTPQLGVRVMDEKEYER